MEVTYQGEARHPEPVLVQPLISKVHEVAHEVLPVPSYHGY